MGKPVVLGCDNLGFALRLAVEEVLRERGVAFESVGVDSPDDQTPYPLIAQRVAEAILKSGYAKDGILLCGTGIGMAISANKFPGLYAACCHDIYSAERARLSNNTNVLTMGALVVGPALARRLVVEWLSREFAPGRSTAKVEAVRAIEDRNFRKPVIISD